MNEENREEELKNQAYSTQCAHCGAMTVTSYKRCSEIPLEEKEVFCDTACRDLGSKNPDPERRSYYKFCVHDRNPRGTSCIGVMEDWVVINIKKAELENRIKARCVIEEKPLAR